MSGTDDPLALYGAVLVIVVGWIIGAGVVIHNWGFAAAGTAACGLSLLLAMRGHGYPRALALMAGLLLTVAMGFGTSQITVNLQSWGPNSPVSEYSCGSTLHYALTLLGGREFTLEDPAFVVYPSGEVAHLRSVCGQRLSARDRLMFLFLWITLACLAAGLLSYMRRRRLERTPRNP